MRRVHVWTRLNPSDLEAIVEVINEERDKQGSAPLPKADRTELEREITYCIQATGLVCDGTEESRLWREAEQEEPNASAEARRYLYAAERRNPLDPKRLNRLEYLCLTRYLSVHRPGNWDCLTTRDRRPRLIWDDLTDVQRQDVRDALTAIAENRKANIRKGPPTNDPLNRTLQLLAEVWLRFTGLQIEEHELTIWSRNYADKQDSRFLRFLQHCLTDAVGPGEGSSGALARRWERIRQPDRDHAALMERIWAAAEDEATKH